jgi:leucyl aminopeptidase (aminopeptidase T)
MLPTYPESTRLALARQLLRDTLRVSRGENVLIETWSATMDWALSLNLEARLLGARPLLSVKDESVYWRSLSDVPASQIGRIGEHEWAALRASDAYVYFYGPLDAEREETLPRAAARRAESNNHELMRLIQKFGIRSVRWDLGRTNALWARRYGVDLRAWRNELVDATLVDPKVMRREGVAIADRLRRGREATISHENGTHLALRLAGRRPKVDDGVIDDEDIRQGNVILVVPTGVTSVTVDERYAEGTIVTNGTGVLFGRTDETPLSRGRWRFRDGSLAEFGNAGGGAKFHRELRALGDVRMRAGQLSVGLNPRISTIPLLFDQERGTITFEIGRNVQMGGRSRGPRIFAYLSLRGGTLEIDGETIVDRGNIVVS